MSLRLGFPSVGPPVPRVEHEEVHPSPRLASLDRTQLQDSTHLLPDYVHQVWRAVQINGHSIILRDNYHIALYISSEMIGHDNLTGYNVYLNDCMIQLESSFGL